MKTHDAIVATAKRICKQDPRPACSVDNFIPIELFNGELFDLSQLAVRYDLPVAVSCSCLSAYADGDGCTTCARIPESEGSYCAACTDTYLDRLDEYNWQLDEEYCSRFDTPGGGEASLRGPSESDGREPGMLLNGDCYSPDAVAYPYCGPLQCDPEQLPSHLPTGQYSDLEYWSQLNSLDLRYLQDLYQQNQEAVDEAILAYETALAAYVANPELQAAYAVAYQNAYEDCREEHPGLMGVPYCKAYATRVASEATNKPKEMDFPPQGIVNFEDCAMQMLYESTQSTMCLWTQVYALPSFIAYPNWYQQCHYDEEFMATHVGECSTMKDVWSCIFGGSLYGVPSDYMVLNKTLGIMIPSWANKLLEELGMINGWKSWFEWWNGEDSDLDIEITNGGSSYGCPRFLAGSLQVQSPQGPYCIRRCVSHSNVPDCDAGMLNSFTDLMPGSCDLPFECR